MNVGLPFTLHSHLFPPSNDQHCQSCKNASHNPKPPTLPRSHTPFWSLFYGILHAIDNEDDKDRGQLFLIRDQCPMYSTGSSLFVTVIWNRDEGDSEECRRDNLYRANQRKDHIKSFHELSMTRV